MGWGRRFNSGDYSVRAAGIYQFRPDLFPAATHDSVNSFRERILTHVSDPRQRAIIASNLSTEVPRTADNIGKNWPEYMFESMPSIAAITMLTKLQSDVRTAEGEVLRGLVANMRRSGPIGTGPGSLASAASVPGGRYYTYPSSFPH